MKRTHNPEGYTCTNCGKFTKFTICQSDANGNRGRLMARVCDPLSLLTVHFSDLFLLYSAMTQTRRVSHAIFLGSRKARANHLPHRQILLYLQTQRQVSFRHQHPPVYCQPILRMPLQSTYVPLLDVGKSVLRRFVHSAFVVSTAAS